MGFAARCLLTVAVAALAVVPSAASPVHELVKRAPLPTCDHDNLYRLFIDTRYSSSASQFCSVYIASTTTATATTTPGVTVTSTPMASVTTTPTATTSLTVTTTVTTVFVTSTETDAATVTVSLINEKALKKAKKVGGRGASITAPDMAMTYGSSRLSSACSCLVTPSTVTVSATATAMTTTSTAVAVTVTVTVTASTVFTTITSFSSVTDTESATTTITSTATSTAILPNPGLCNNAGLQFAIYSNPYVNNINYYTYPNFDPTYFKSATPEFNDVTTSVGVEDASGADTNVYDSSVMPIAQQTVNHRGYLFTTQTGYYNFTFGFADDISMFWLGTYAYSGWKRQNEVAEQDYFGNTPTQSLFLTVNTYYPLRIIWGNAQGGAVFEFSITAPDGTVILGPNSGAAIDIVQYSCDGVLAPQYAAFGSES